VFGRNLATGWLLTKDEQGNLLSLEDQIGAIASMPDSSWCELSCIVYLNRRCSYLMLTYFNVHRELKGSSPPPYPEEDGVYPGYPAYLNWALVVGVYNMPLNVFCLLNVYIPLRQCLGPFIVGQVGLLSLAYLQFECTPETCEIPVVCQQVLAAFAATWTAMIVEIVQGLPSAISIIPVLFIFAPGSSSVLSVIGVMHRRFGDTLRTNESSWTSLSMDAFSYGIGIYLGQEVWRSVIREKFLVRKRKAWKNMKQNSTDISDDDQDLKTFASIREAYHKPQTIHGVGPLTNRRKSSNADTSDDNEESIVQQSRLASEVAMSDTLFGSTQWVAGHS